MWYYMFYAGLIAVLGAMGFQIVRLCALIPAYRAAATSAGSLSLAGAGFVFLTLSLGFRVLATGRPPFSNMWEYLVAFAWAALGFYVLYERRYRDAAIGVATLVLVGLLLITPELLFSSRISPLVPALQNNRLLTVHVALMLLSYGGLGVAFVAAVLYLVQSSWRRVTALPPTDTLDELGHRAVLIGFPMLAAGIALGAYWGNIAWGRYWGWDPKETTALVTWLVFAGYLHARNLADWRGRRAAWLIVAGFAVIVFNIFAVNFWIAGLHSYARPS